MCPFRNSLYRERENIKTHAVRFTGDERVRKERASEEDYEEELSRNYQALLKFYDTFFGSDETEEDKLLTHWRKWMDERKKMHLQLGLVHNREAGNLVMNIAETYRMEQELKNLIECGQIIQPPDKYRGHPSFWKTPELLFSHCVCRGPTNKVPLYGRLRPVQLGIMPELEYVGVPDDINRAEKGIIGESSGRTQWTKSKYLQQRFRDLASNISYIMDYYPKIEDLYIRGKAYATTVQETLVAKAKREVPKVLFEIIDDVDPGLRQSQKPTTNQLPPGEAEAPPVAKLRVGNVLLWREVTCVDKDSSPVPHYHASGPLRYSLDITAPVGARATAFLRVENLGRCTLSLLWVQLRGPGLAADGRPRPQRFFFDKRDAACPPGQVLQVEVWFRSDAPGVFREKWELRVEPRVTPPGSRFVVGMWGLAEDVGGDVDDEASGILGPASADALLRHVADCASRAQAELATQELTGPRLRRVPTPPPYRTLYLEGEVFEYVNPAYHYEFRNIQRLKEVFTAATGRPSTEWDLSLRSLKQLLLHPPEPLSLDAQQKLLETLTEVAQMLLMPVPLPEDLTRAGTRAVAYAALCGFANSLEREACNLLKIYSYRPSSPGSAPTASPVSHLVGRSRLVSTALWHDDSVSAFDSTTASVASDERADDHAHDQYLAALFVRAYHLLGDAVDRVEAAISAPDLLGYDVPQPAFRHTVWSKKMRDYYAWRDREYPEE